MHRPAAVAPEPPRGVLPATGCTGEPVAGRTPRRPPSTLPQVPGPLEPIGPPTGSSGNRARLDRWQDVGSG